MNRAVLTTSLVLSAIAPAASALGACSHDEPPPPERLHATSLAPRPASSGEGMGATMAQPPSIVPAAERPPDRECDGPGGGGLPRSDRPR